MHPLCGALHMPFASVKVTSGALVIHQYSYALYHCRNSQYCMTFIFTQYLYGIILVTACMMLNWWVLRAGSKLHGWPELHSPFLSSTVLSFCGLALWG